MHINYWQKSCTKCSYNRANNAPAIKPNTPRAHPLGDDTALFGLLDVAAAAPEAGSVADGTTGELVGFDESDSVYVAIVFVLLWLEVMCWVVDVAVAFELLTPLGDSSILDGSAPEETWDITHVAASSENISK